jgi:hypothetical protein
MATQQPPPQRQALLQQQRLPLRPMLPLLVTRHLQPMRQLRLLRLLPLQVVAPLQLLLPQQQQQQPPLPQRAATVLSRLAKQPSPSTKLTLALAPQGSAPQVVLKTFTSPALWRLSSGLFTVTPLEQNPRMLSSR